MLSWAEYDNSANKIEFVKPLGNFLSLDEIHILKNVMGRAKRRLKGENATSRQWIGPKQPIPKQHLLPKPVKSLGLNSSSTISTPRNPSTKITQGGMLMCNKTLKPV